MITTRTIIAAAFACACAVPAAAQTPVPAVPSVPQTPGAPAVAVPVPPSPPAVSAPDNLPPDWHLPDFHAWPQLPELPHLPEWPLVADVHVPDFDFHFDFSAADFQDIAQNARAMAERFAAQGPFQVPPVPPVPPVRIEGFPFQSGSLYDQARGYIDRNQYDRALEPLDRLIGARGDRAEAAMYWKAYSLSKLARRTEALATIAELRKQYPKSPWVDEARGLEIEIKQASGQPVSADAIDDEELKLLALRGVMQSDPETTIPLIEKMLAGPSSVRLKDRALFVVSQSRSPRARQLVINFARNSTNPDLKRSAIRYLGRMSGTEGIQVLDEIYRGTNDVELKRTILQSFMESRARDRLLAVARSEQSATLRGEAVQYLGSMRAAAELEELYRTETDVEVKKRILQAMFSSQAADKIGPIARNEKDPELRRYAIRQLGASNRTDAAETLVAIYGSDTSIETRKAIIDALAVHRDATPLVTLARAEKNAELKTEMVRRLSTSRSQVARDYMLELLK